MDSQQPLQQQQPDTPLSTEANKATVTHNLDTGEDEPLEKTSLDDEEMMDFGSGSGGGSGGDGAAA